MKGLVEPDVTAESLREKIIVQLKDRGMNCSEEETPVVYTLITAMAEAMAKDLNDRKEWCRKYHLAVVDEPMLECYFKDDDGKVRPLVGPRTKKPEFDYVIKVDTTELDKAQIKAEMLAATIDVINRNPTITPINVVVNNENPSLSPEEIVDKVMKSLANRVRNGVGR